MKMIIYGYDGDDYKADSSILTDRGLIIVKNTAVNVHKNKDQMPFDEFARNVYLYKHHGPCIWQIGNYDVSYVTSVDGKKICSSTFDQIFIMDEKLYAHNVDDFIYEVDISTGAVLSREYKRG